MSDVRRDKPLISLVVPTYNVAAYLPEFLASLDEQTVERGLVELVFVADGATDDSPRLIQEWMLRSDFAARMITTENGGLARARNTGLDAVTGDWVSFPDPDDRLAPHYLRLIAKHLSSEFGKLDALVIGNLLMLNDVTGEVTDNHPLRAKFSGGKRAIDLERLPQYVHLQAASAFYRRGVVEALGLRFDHRIRPNFEDGSFTTLYLALGPSRRMTVIPQAHYCYRQRSDGTSLVQGSWTKPEKFNDLLLHGHLALLRQLSDSLGRVPVWAQNVILYDLAFYFRSDARANSVLAGLPAETLAPFHRLLPEILAYIDESSIDAFTTTWLNDDMRQAMLITGKGTRTRPREIVIDKIDEARRLLRVSYYFGGELPHETYRVRGWELEPVFAKIREVRFLGRVMARERIVWLPANGAVSADLDGHRVELAFGTTHRRRFVASPWVFWPELLDTEPPDDLYVDTPPTISTRPRARLGRVKRQWLGYARQVREFIDTTDEKRRELWVTRAAVGIPLLRRRFRDAWLFIDRDDQAQDNAERLYEWVAANRPDVNAWFVLNRDSSDWARLKKAGFRLIAHRSLLHRVALLRAQHVISSQVDHYIVSPLSWEYGPRRWQYSFLQHGVTKDDLSNWINSKPISLMITATPDEQRSIVGDGTPYVYTGKETRLTGFPRHDRLLQRAAAVTPEARKLILITPTWRRYLLDESLGSGNARKLRTDFWETEYARQWRQIVESPLVHDAASDMGFTIQFVPHPNMQDYLDDSPLPEWIDVRRFRQIDIQDSLARTAVLVTDYSSLAFESAYLERTTVYFQFDRHEFFSGGHAYRKGSWDYVADGFGPVTETASDAVAAIVAGIRGGGVPAEPYAARAAAAFPFRDGRCCERTYDAIRQLTEPTPYDEAFRKIIES